MNRRSDGFADDWGRDRYSYIVNLPGHERMFMSRIYYCEWILDRLPARVHCRTIGQDQRGVPQRTVEMMQEKPEFKTGVCTTCKRRWERIVSGKMSPREDPVAYVEKFIRWNTTEAPEWHEEGNSLTENCIFQLQSELLKLRLKEDYRFDGSCSSASSLGFDARAVAGVAATFHRKNNGKMHRVLRSTCLRKIRVLRHFTVV